MTPSEQNLQNCRSALEQLRTALNGAKNMPPPDPQAAVVFDRFVQVLNFLEARVKAMEAALMTTSQSQNLQSQLQGLLGGFRNFLQNAAQWQQFNNALDQVLVTVAVVPFVPVESAADQYTSALADFMKFRDQALKQAEDRAAKMEERVKALDGTVTAMDSRAKDIQNQVNQEKSRLDSIISAAQQQVAKLLQDEQTRYSGAEAQRTKIVTDNEAKRDAEHKAKLTELAAKFEQMSDAKQKEFSTITDTHRKMAEEAATALKQQLQEASRLVGLIANTGMAGHYQKEANVDWWSMWILRIVATGFFIGAICAIHSLIKAVHASQIDWEMVIFRFALVAVVLIPAFYFARESALHMRREARNRRIELELSALQPFIARLPEKEAQEIIKKKADQYFGQEPPPDQDENNLLRGVSLRGDQVLKILTKVLAAWRGK